MRFDDDTIFQCHCAFDHSIGFDRDIFPIFAPASMIAAGCIFDMCIHFLFTSGFLFPVLKLFLIVSEQIQFQLQLQLLAQHSASACTLPPLLLMWSPSACNVKTSPGTTGLAKFCIIDIEQ